MTYICLAYAFMCDKATIITSGPIDGLVMICGKGGAWGLFCLNFMDMA